MRFLAIALMGLWATFASADPSPDPDWRTSMAANPWETDTAKLCGEIDPPRHARHSSSERVRDCYQKISVRVDAAQRTTTDSSASLDGAAAACRSSMESAPYAFAGFNPEQACAQFVYYINADARAIHSGAQDKADAASRRRVEQNQRYRLACLRQTTDAFKASLAARAERAKTIDPVTIRDVLPDERIPEERERIATEVATCESEISRRRDERKASAPTRDVRELRAVPTALLLPEERERIAAEDSAHAALIAKRRSDPKWIAPVLSASICMNSTMKDAAAKEIQTERAYASRYGGVIDKSKIYTLQQQIRSADEATSAARDFARKNRVPIQSCSVTAIKRLAACLREPTDAGCDDEAIRAYLELELP